MKRGLLIGCVLIALAAAAAAAVRQIEWARVKVMKGPGSYHPVVGELVKGAEVEVLDERGSWAHIQREELDGFIPLSAFDRRSRQDLPADARGSGSQRASSSSETAAVKGFGEDVEKAHAAAVGVDWSLLERIDGHTVSPEQMRSFLLKRGFEEGGIAP